TATDKAQGRPGRRASPRTPRSLQRVGAGIPLNAEKFAPKERRRRHLGPGGKPDGGGFSNDRLNAITQLESRALGRPKDTIGHPEVELPEDIEAMLALAREEKIALLAMLRAEGQN